jgi:hypothetical protein
MLYGIDGRDPPIGGFVAATATTVARSQAEFFFYDPQSHSDRALIVAGFLGR